MSRAENRAQATPALPAVQVQSSLCCKSPSCKSSLVRLGIKSRKTSPSRLLGKTNTNAPCHTSCLAMTSHNIGDAQRPPGAPLSAMRRVDSLAPARLALRAVLRTVYPSRSQRLGVRHCGVPCASLQCYRPPCLLRCNALRRKRRAGPAPGRQSLPLRGLAHGSPGGGTESPGRTARRTFRAPPRRPRPGLERSGGPERSPASPDVHAPPRASVCQVVCDVICFPRR